jgi:prepilin-type N-terminal cleavage/methylation domain-containing protein
MRTIRKAAQQGFTLIELIIVIIIISILAAVAIPNLTTSSDGARCGVQEATLGALKSAWSIAYSVNSPPTIPTSTQIAAQMAEPTCSASGATISCAVPTNAGGASTNYTATGGASGVASPTDITWICQ